MTWLIAKYFWPTILLELLLGFLLPIMNTRVAQMIGSLMPLAIDGKVKLLLVNIKTTGFLFLGIILLKAILQLLNILISKIAHYKFKKSVLEQVLSYLATLTMDTEAISTRLNTDLEKAVNLQVTVKPMLVVELFAAIYVWYAIFNINRWLSVELLAIALILAIFPIIFSKHFRDMYTDLRVFEEREDKLKRELVSCFSLIKLFNLNTKIDVGYKKLLKPLYRQSLKLEKYWATIGGLEDGLKIFAEFIVILVIALFADSGRLEKANIFTVLLLFKSLTQSLASFGERWLSMSEGKISLNRLKELVPLANKAPLIKKDFQQIDLRDISFSYGEKQLLHKLNLQILSCDKILIKGPNGSGKTTLMKIILGLLTNYDGDIYMDGININDCRKQNLAWIPQNHITFADTLAWNAELLASDQVKVKEMLKEFRLDDESVDVEQFSGGQKRKLSLIRGFASDSELIVLDEPTNNIDQEGFEILSKFIATTKRTLLIVSHDEKLASLCNKAFQLADGQLIELEKESTLVSC